MCVCVCLVNVCGGQEEEQWILFCFTKMLFVWGAAQWLSICYVPVRTRVHFLVPKNTDTEEI